MPGNLVGNGDLGFRRTVGQPAYPGQRREGGTMVLAGLAQQGIEVGRRHGWRGCGATWFVVPALVGRRGVFDHGGGVPGELTAGLTRIDLDANPAVWIANQ